MLRVKMVFPNFIVGLQNITILETYERSVADKAITQYEHIAFMSATKRVISCLVNEQLATSSLIRISKTYKSGVGGFWVVLRSKQKVHWKIWIPIAKKITEKNINFDIEKGTVHFLDPSDLGEVALLSDSSDQSTIRCRSVTEIKQIFEMLLVDSENRSTIYEVVSEINNSIQHQILAYKDSLAFVPLWSIRFD